MRTAATKVGYEPVPGYTLRKRLGAGGYGEVWLADAPGGLHKAVKLIYGTVDQSHATSELKSLERIRQVSHPFLLSLERIEIVENQVVIITELAESSLLDRYEQYRRKGAPGIPRATLLEFLHDTADALDFLAQKHSLQHLDVKPGNLLLVADRIKVADFGLVKDLHDQTQSLVSGLTPTYSAPEIFDGRPGYRSDQYSLAIVYMEMLTGQLPFNGTTTGELARQHLSQSPILDPLPPADRQVVARALAKNPLDRFASCRQFVEQLQKSRGAALPQTTPAAQNQTGAAQVDSFQPLGAVVPGTSTVNVLNAVRSCHKRIDISDIECSWQATRCMFVGLGGTGGAALLHLRREIQQNCDSHFGMVDHGWLAIDTAIEQLRELTKEGGKSALPEQQALHLPIFKPADYRGESSELFVPLSRRWLYNIPKSLKTDGVRPLAILALLDHYEPLKAKLKVDLQALICRHNDDGNADQPLRIYLLTSLHGGTGSSLVCEMGLLIRRLMRELSFSQYRICAVVSSALTTNAAAANLASASALSCLSEMNYLMSGENEVLPIHYSDHHLGTSNQRPFDWVTLVDGGLHGSASDLRSTVASLANNVLVDSQTMMGAVLSEDRLESAAKPNGWLRTGCAAPIQVSNRVTAQNLARWCAEQALKHAAEYMHGRQGMATSSVSTGDPASSKPTVSGDVILSPQASEEFTLRLMRDLGVIRTVGRLEEIAATEDGDNLLARWARRLSRKNEMVSLQLQHDIRTWQESIAKIVQMRVYNWKQVEKIQLNVIEGILDYCENETATLVQLFEPFSELLGSPEQMLADAVKYLRTYAEECVKLLGQFQSGGKALAAKLQAWGASIEAEKQLQESSLDIHVGSLPSQFQMLVNRVNSVLESTLHIESMRILSEAVDGLCGGNKTATPLVPDNMTLKYFLSLASDLVPRIAQELGVDPNELTEDGAMNVRASGTGENSGQVPPVQLHRLDAYVPALSHYGGELFRFALAPQEQVDALKTALREKRLEDTTSIVPVCSSFGTFVACDASHLSISGIVAGLWRPSPATMQLAERVRTRVDIDWEPATGLQEIVAEPPSSEATGQVLPAVECSSMFCSSPGTVPIGQVFES